MSAWGAPTDSASSAIRRRGLKRQSLPGVIVKDFARHSYAYPVFQCSGLSIVPNDWVRIFGATQGHSMESCSHLPTVRVTNQTIFRG
jgi:hypothetical protein